jgi:hypothetical protein
MYVRPIFDGAKPIAPDAVDGWSYSPWCDGTLTTDGGPRALSLYLGGRGRLAGDGDAGDLLFSFDARAFEDSITKRPAPAATTAPVRPSIPDRRALVPRTGPCDPSFPHAYRVRLNADGQAFVTAVGAHTSAPEATAAHSPCYATGPHRGFNGENWCCSF